MDDACTNDLEVSLSDRWTTSDASDRNVIEKQQLLYLSSRLYIESNSKTDVVASQFELRDGELLKLLPTTWLGNWILSAISSSLSIVIQRSRFERHSVSLCDSASADRHYKAQLLKLLHNAMQT